MKDASPTQTRVLIFAPAGRDAHLASTTLERAGILPFVCPNAGTFCAELAKGAAAGLITEEAIVPEIRRKVTKVLEAQPLWSDLPILMLASRPPTARGRLLLAGAVAELGNATVLERPIDPDTMVGAVRSSLRARDRQYQARQLLRQL
ncbi:MAG: hypothetical protein QOI66_809, partial [Myxococcales bacterium]|nr:hypothetical protein [Myxococcales bacterium]